MARGFKRLGLAGLAAVATQPLMMAVTLVWLSVLDGSLPSAENLEVAGFLVMLTAVYMVVLFWPAFFLLRCMGWLRTGSVALAGLVLGAAPAVLLSFTGRAFSGSARGGDWHGRQVNFIVDNSITLHGWLMYGELCLLAGLHGLAAALAFWYVWRRVS